MLRFSPACVWSSPAPTTLTIKPTAATRIMSGPSTSCGALRRPQASQTIHPLMTRSVAPFTSAARISMRTYPNVRSALGGRSASRIAIRERANAATSASMCPESARSASRPVRSTSASIGDRGLAHHPPSGAHAYGQGPDRMEIRVGAPSLRRPRPSRPELGAKGVSVA